MGRAHALLAGAVALGIAVAPAAAASNDDTPEQVVVTGAVHARAHSIRPDEVVRSETLTIADALNESMPSAILSDTEANPFQPDLFYRGFDASPVLGTAEGLAVYQNGDRINEAFGDTVLWDMVPLFAVSRIDVIPGSDAVLGLNALGGAVALDMKTGLDAGTSGIEVSAGSFGRAKATAQIFEHRNNDGFYAGVSAMHDDGWRRSSPSNLIQFYADYGSESGRASWGISASYATDKLSENAAVPIQDDPRAAFAIPDVARDSVLLLQARGEYDLASGWALRGDMFLRSTVIKTFNGQASGFAPCASDPAELCDHDGDVLQTLGGGSIPASAIGDGTLGAQLTRTDAFGATAQLDWSDELLTLSDTATLGTALDIAPTTFSSLTELGVLLFEPGGVTTVASDGIFLGGNSWNVRLRAVNSDAGIYVENSLQLSPTLSLRVAGRWNLDRIDLRDRFGTALSGDHTFSGFNPQARLSWQPDGETNVYVAIGQSSRTPTAAELSCANANLPCLFPLSFVSDPGLHQVIARTAELGASGKVDAGEFHVSWLADVYNTRNSDDILFVSSGSLIGSGYFSNVGTTERRGAEATVRVAWDDFDLSANYGYLDATFRSAFVEPSAFNPGADGNGNIFVSAGDRIPAIPQNSVKLSLGWAATSNLHLRLQMISVSGEYLRGDEANLQPQLPGYSVFNAGADLNLTESLILTLDAQNILDRRYSTFGLFSDPTGNGAFPQFTNPRFAVPAPPFGLWLGFKAAW